MERNAIGKEINDTYFKSVFVEQINIRKYIVFFCKKRYIRYSINIDNNIC